MLDNTNTDSGEQNQENPYPKFEPLQEQQQQDNPADMTQSEQYTTIAYGNPQQNEELNEPLIGQGNQHNSEKNIDTFLKVIKYLNIGAGLFVGIVGLYFVITLKIWNFSNFLMSFYSMFLPIYYIFFGALLFLAEYYRIEVSIYFRFLRSYLGRGIFNLFLACQSGLAWNNPGYFFSSILFSLGIIYIFLHFIQEKVQEDVKNKLLN